MSAALAINKNNFKQEVLSSEIPVLVDFWAAWCGPCRMLSPVVDEIAKERQGSVKVVKINVDEEPELARDFNIMSIPTLALIKKGKVVSTSVGVRPKEAIEEMLK